MALKFYMIFLITASVVGQFQFFSITDADQCDPEEVLIITNQNSDILNEKIESSSLLIKQRYDEAKDAIEQELESSAQTVLNEIKKTLDNLKDSDCVKPLQLQFDTKKTKIDALQTKCVIQSTKKVSALEKKVQSATKKSQSLKTKADTVLQKCAKNSLIGCSFVKNCCKQVVIQLTYKVDSESLKIDNIIGKVESEQKKCAKKATNEALELQEGIAAELVACGAPDADPEVSGESKESSETLDSNESKSTESGDEGPQTTTQSPAQTETSTSSQEETETHAQSTVDSTIMETNLGVTTDITNTDVPIEDNGEGEHPKEGQSDSPSSYTESKSEQDSESQQTEPLN